MREEMNVRVIDGQVAPRSLRHAESMIADGCSLSYTGFHGCDSIAVPFVLPSYVATFVYSAVTCIRKR